MRSGITRRWLRGNLLITVLVVLLAEAMFLYSYTRSYYGSVQQIMYRRFSSVTGQLKMYTGDTAQSAAVSRSLALRRMVEQFADKDKYEFMLLDSYGSVIASSSGTDAEGIVSSRDFEQALGAPDGLGVAVYRTQSGEMVMAACSLVPYDAEDVAALRLVTSLALVERQVKNAVIVSVFIAVAILLFTVMSGLYFVRGIVVPLGQVERTAAGIARGELDVRLPLTGDPHDEVDRLRGTINQMAEGLEETEKMKNEFISSVSHELRTPLTSIRGWVETLRTLAAEEGVVAMGETGLDYFYTPETKAQQQTSFRDHIRIGRELNKPVIVHTRDARADTLAILREEKVTDCGGVLHCFTEDRETAGKLLDLGFYISFSGIVTFRNAEQLRDAARYVPLDRLLVETDSPYLAPVPHRGKENQPAMVRDVAEYMAVLKGVAVEELAQVTTDNFARLFHIDASRLQSIR